MRVPICCCLSWHDGVLSTSSPSSPPADVVKETGFGGRTVQAEPVLAPAVSLQAFPSFSSSGRVYRLTDGRGLPHAVLDELFESLDAAHDAALDWIAHHQLVEPGAAAAQVQAALCQHFGIEVSTPSGDWRTLRHAGMTLSPQAC